jgi:putative ABC transport system permease protein
MTGVAVLSLAVGLAAAAGAVSLIDGFGFRPLAVANPDSLVEVRSLYNTGGSGGQLSYLDFQDLRDRARAFSALSFYSVRGAGLSGPEAPPEVVLANAVSPDYFQTLGVTLALGRPFQDADVTADAQTAVVLSQRLWQRRFGGDPGVIRRTVDVNGSPCAIIGVAPATFTGLDAFIAPDFWIPLVKWMPQATRQPRDARSLTVVGRLRDPITRLDALRSMLGVRPSAVRRAQGEVDAVVAVLRDAYPATNRDERANVVTIMDARRAPIRTLVVLLMAMVAVVLLVGCANVAGLLLGRAEERRHEMAIRVAIGASPRRLIRQLLTESLVLSFFAAASGLALAIGIVRALPALLPPMGMPLGFVFQLDRRVVMATAAAAIGTSIAFGVWPAWTMARQGIAQAARTTGASDSGRIRSVSVRNLLVVGQVSVSLVLLVTGALLARSAQRSRTIDPGFKVRPLLLASLAPAAAGYDDVRARQFVDALVERLQATPGIVRVSLARRIPLDPNGGGATRDVTFPHQPVAADGQPFKIKFNAVSPTYFEVMGTRIVRGRAFTDHDGPRDARVVLINETMARRYWPASDAIGQHLVVHGPGAGDYEVVGVFEDGKIIHLTESPQPYMCFAVAQVPSSEPTLIVDAKGDSRAAATVRDAIRALDPDMPTISIMTLAEHMRFARYESNLAAIIVGSLSAGGLMLSIIGLYGVVSFVVARRTKEIGVRMALGAQPRDIARSVLRQAMGLALTGVAIGVTLSLVVSRVLQGSLYGVSPSDPASFVGTAAGVLIVSLAASWWPARKAMRTDPVVALRTE